jgi:hypothetical protein
MSGRRRRERNTPGGETKLMGGTGSAPLAERGNGLSRRLKPGRRARTVGRRAGAGRLSQRQAGRVSRKAEPGP